MESTGVTGDQVFTSADRIRQLNDIDQVRYLFIHGPTQDSIP